MQLHKNSSLNGCVNFREGMGDTANAAGHEIPETKKRNKETHDSRFRWNAGERKDKGAPKNTRGESRQTMEYQFRALKRPNHKEDASFTLN